ncbi:MAG TPA: TonB-dependent receptor [Thermoanaerobaculia bacterium]|nr:TonB-dependent receptor [Thermoanaerobaculia bacterium]
MRKVSGALCGPFLFFLLLFSPALAGAFDGLLLRPDGSPAAGYQVSVVGLPISVTADAEGRFRISPDPALPFRLVATSPGGEVSAPIEVTTLPETGSFEAIMPATFQDSVTVTSGVAPGLETPPAAATTTVGKEDLEQRRPHRLVDAVQGIAGVSRSEEGPTGVPAIRGLTRGRTLVLLDGARVTTERRAGASAAYVDPFTLASVEIARGPGSVAYGSDAFGGVINASSRYPDPGSPMSLSYSLNSGLGGDDEDSFGVEASGDLLGGALLGQFHMRKAGEAESADGDSIFNSAYEDRGGAVRYAVDTPAGRLRAGFALSDGYDIGNPAVDSNVTRAFYPKESSRRFNLALDSGQVGGWENLEMALFLGNYRLALTRDRLPTETVTRRIDRSDTRSDDGSLRAVGTRPVLGGRLQVGAEVVARLNLESTTKRETFDLAGNQTGITTPPAIDDAQRTDTGLFVSYDRSLGARNLISAGVRGDRIESENRGGFFGDRSASHSALSGYAAFTSNPVSNVTTSLQIARGFRDPTLSDRFFRGPTGRGFVTGNPDLDPERSLQYDGSVRWTIGRGSVAAFGYLYKIDDLIERFSDNGADFFFRNRGEAEIRGFEIEGQTPLGSGFTLELAITATKGEADGGEPIDDIPARGGFATVRWADERHFAYVRGASFQRDDRPGPIEVERPGYTTVELGAGWHLSDYAELRLVGRNLTDERFWESADETATLARGRSFALGIVGKI